MKKLFVITAAFAAIAPALFAQTLNITAPGYSGAKLFDSTPGFTISGMGADSSGNVYYLELDGGFAASTKLYKRTAAGGYATATELFNYGAFTFGSFVTVQAGRVYFGESSASTIRSVDPDGTNPLLIGTVFHNYDLAFSSGTAFVSADPDTTGTSSQNRVSTLNLATGATQVVLNATPDFSGPIDFDAAGNLIYGVAKAAIGGIYRYSAAAVATAISTSTPIVLTPPTGRVAANGGNQYLAYAGGSTLWQDDYNYSMGTGTGTLRNYDLSSASATTVASGSDSIGNLDYAGGALYASVTDFGTNRSAVFAVVPEPSSAMLLALGALALARRRR